MSNSLMPLNDSAFWWLRYGLGIALPLVLIGCGVASIATGHSYTVWGTRTSLHLVPVQGEQAVLMGAAYQGLALMIFANCYAQYHERMGFYYQWLLAPGALVAGGGMFWCSWIFLAR